jgi:hypothetical protein
MTSLAASSREERVVATLSAWARRLAAARSGSEPERARAMLAVAAVVFVLASVLGLRSLPEVGTDVLIWPLVVLALVGVPLTVAVNGWEYAVIAHVLRHRVRVMDAARISVLSTAANLLPIPGAMLVRARALKGLGTGFGKALSVTVLMGVCRVGVAGALAGGLQLVFADGGPGAAVAGGGMVVLGGFWWALRRDPAAASDPAVLLEVLGVQAGAVGVGALRLWVVLHALGYDASVTQAVALSVASVLASVLGFFPAGLGVRELLAAVIAPVVGLPAAVGLVVTAVDRVIGLAVFAALTTVLMVTHNTGTEDSEDEVDEPVDTLAGMG